MATETKSIEVYSIGQAIFEITMLVYQHGYSAEDAVQDVVSRIPTEDLGTLILRADQYADPYKVKCRAGFTSRYPQSWEVYLRETLESILTVALNLD